MNYFVRDAAAARKISFTEIARVLSISEECFRDRLRHGELPEAEQMYITGIIDALAHVRGGAPHG